MYKLSVLIGLSGHSFFFCKLNEVSTVTLFSKFVRENEVWSDSYSDKCLVTANHIFCSACGAADVRITIDGSELKK